MAGWGLGVQWGGGGVLAGGQPASCLALVRL